MVELVLIFYFHFLIVRFHRLIEHLKNSIQFDWLNHSKEKRRDELVEMNDEILEVDQVEQ